MLRKDLLIFLLLAAISASAAPGVAGIIESAGQAIENLAGGSPSPDDLTTSEITDGLVEALQNGVGKAVARASEAGGFLSNPAIRIPLPETVRTAGDMLRTVGMGGVVESFETTMNTAAEKASAEALPVLAGAVRELTFEDVKKIWKGGDTAATDYFRTKTWEGLYEKFRPVVADSTATAGVTASYQKLVKQPLVAGLVANTQLDLDHYVTEGALSGLFTLMAEEEKKIRTDPMARTSELLEKVFGD